MIEPELKQYLTSINKSIDEIHKGRWWKGFVDGLMRGFGYVIGVILALVLLGWILNIIGIVPAFKQEVEQWRKLLQETQKQTSIIQRTVDPNGISR